MLLKFTTGTTTGQITEMTSLIGTVTLNQGYNNTNYNIIAAYASEPTNISAVYGNNDTAPLIGVPLSGSTFALYAAIPFMPKANTPYAISIITMGAGATS
jgi:phosphoribosylcarboxyaminoimidazole (NCAIR) mutase